MSTRSMLSCRRDRLEVEYYKLKDEMSSLAGSHAAALADKEEKHKLEVSNLAGDLEVAYKRIREAESAGKKQREADADAIRVANETLGGQLDPLDAMHKFVLGTLIDITCIPFFFFALCDCTGPSMLLLRLQHQQVWTVMEDRSFVDATLCASVSCSRACSGLANCYPVCSATGDDKRIYSP